MAALSVCAEMIRLRRVARRLDLDRSLDAALNAVGRGDSAMAVGRLSEFDRVLAAARRVGPASRAPAFL